MLNLKLLSSKKYHKLQSQIHLLHSEIQEANEFIKEFRHQELGQNHSLPHATDNNLRQSLVQMKDDMGRLLQKERERGWITQGIAKFADILRQDYDNIRDLSQQIISNMVKYLGAHQGGLFFANEEDEYTILEMMATYAYNREMRVKHKEIIVSDKAAEGLIGQVYINKKSICLSDVPSNYHKIDLGLGESQASHLLVSPLISNQEILGVIELASFKHFSPYHIEFVEKVGESIASTIMAAHINEKTQTLLLATRAQTQELRQQEQDLRENMIQLETTQQKMRKVNQELKYTFSTINSAMLSAEFDLNGCVIKANNRYLRFLGYKYDEIIGQHHRISVPEEERTSKDYEAFWESLLQGKHFTGEFRRVSKSGFIRWIRGSYYPVKDEDDRIEKILKVAYDITLEKEQEVKLFDQQKVIEKNQLLLKERTKSIQEKAYQRIKSLKAEITKKDAYIKLLEERINIMSSE